MRRLYGILFAAAITLSVRGAFDVRDFGAKGDGAAKDTVAVQKAIDAAHAAGGGEVLLAKGVYLCGSLFLKSGVDFHLAEGAVLKGSPDREDYNALDVAPQNWGRLGSGDNISGGHILLCVEQENVTLRGPGKIDGNVGAFLKMPDGSHPPNKLKIPWRPAQMIWFVESRRITIRDIEIADAPYWSCFIYGCEDVSVERAAIHTVRSPHTYNGDGLDIDSSRRVRVTECRISTADDAVTLRAAGQGRLKNDGHCADVVVSKCTLSSDCNAIRLGVGNGTIRDCSFADIRIENTRYAVNAVGAWSRPERGVDISNINFRDMDIDAKGFCKFYYKHATGSVFDGIKFRHVRGKVREPSIFDDTAERPFRNIVFEDVRLEGESSPRVVGTGSIEHSSPFAAAKPVWVKGQADELNSFVRFKATFDADADTRPCLRITGTSAYRIRLNGRYVGYGPARSPKGFFRVDEWPLAAAMREGCNELEIDAAGYNCNSYYFQDQPAFLQAEVVADGKVLAATAADGGGFSAESTERMRKVPRYSLQRTFAEAYRYGKETNKLPLEPRPEVRYLERIASYPKFELNDSIRVVSRAKATYDPNTQAKGVFFIDTDGKNPRFKAFAKSELESNPWDEAQKIKFSGRVPCSAAQDAPISLRGGDSVRIDAGLNDCGFFGMKVKVAKPGRVLFAFDEVLVDGEVDPRRMMCCNCVEWRFERPGAYEVETFEPYVWRYADLTAIDGDVEVSGLHVRAYKNPDAGRAAFRCSDPALEKIFEAARETFVQNAVDVFTDCPSRERAGWLCDSFFIGRVNKLLTGDTKLERLFLQNYAIADEFEYIPKGAIPMCYPADHPKASFIPNWAMWLVIEVEEYLKRSGDRATVDALKPRLVAFVEYMKTFRNSDGLLEKLPSWVFVEWSQANKLVQDVNYPSNMTWAEVLDVMNRLYGMPELAAEAERVRETVRRQSWTGEWFCDNAVRQADGSLKLSGECTETCQYYAFFFRTATPKTYPRLWKTLVDDFGPKRLGADMKTLKSHPEIWPSNAFIGNYLRLECLAREGLSVNILDETKGFFLYMAERTGTLWEMISPTASCDHGFASHAAVYLFRDILGVKSVDAKSREVVVEPPKDIGLDWCEGTLPILPGETVTIRWRRGEPPTVEWSSALAIP